jgi:hypothetical protein
MNALPRCFYDDFMKTPCRHKILATTVLGRISSPDQGGGQGGTAGGRGETLDTSHLRNVDPQQERDGDDDAFDEGTLIHDDVQDLNLTSNSITIIVVYDAPFES